MPLPGANGVSPFGVQTGQFADGTTWTAKQGLGLADLARRRGPRMHPMERGAEVVGGVRHLRTTALRQVPHPERHALRPTEQVRGQALSRRKR